MIKKFTRANTDEYTFDPIWEDDGIYMLVSDHQKEIDKLNRAIADHITKRGEYHDEITLLKQELEKVRIPWDQVKQDLEIDLLKQELEELKVRLIKVSSEKLSTECKLLSSIDKWLKEKDSEVKE